MKRIINGRRYDTDTAREVASCSHGDGPRDFRYYSETLYCKRSGEYFLAGEGGPMTKYARPVGNARTGGENVFPLTYEQARDWAEREMDADDYEAEFGPAPESDERVVLSVSMDAATADRIRKAAAAAGVSVSALIASRFAE